MRFVLHLRVITPAELRDPVIDALRGNPGVAHLVVHRDGALDPPGDEVTADIARESANEIIEALKALGVKERGAITLDVIDTVLSTRAYRAEERAAGDPADAVVWDELAGRTREESTLNVTYMTFLCLACLIAAVGVVTDSPVTVVGAMVVGPEFGPLAALAVALVRRKTYLARRAALALLIGFPVAMLITAIGVLAGEAVGWIEVTNTRELEEVDFIFQVGPLSFVVALFAGAAGMLSLGVGQVGRPGRRLHLGDDRAGGGIRRRRGDRGGLGYRRQIRRPARDQSVRDRAGRGAGALGARGGRPTALARGRLSVQCGAVARCDEIASWVSKWRWSIAPATHSTGWWRCTRTSSGCVRRRTRAPRSRPTRCRSSPPTTSSTGSRTRSAISWPGWSFRTGPAA